MQVKQRLVLSLNYGLSWLWQFLSVRIISNNIYKYIIHRHISLQLMTATVFITKSMIKKILFKNNIGYCLIDWRSKDNHFIKSICGRKLGARKIFANSKKTYFGKFFAILFKSCRCKFSSVIKVSLAQQWWYFWPAEDLPTCYWTLRLERSLSELKRGSIGQ
jgi:hypothetical protein